jgi:pyrimidine operon attenuation protein/uracil phosphoribosyltransferase
VVADDVSMTGKTMLYALQPFLKDKPKKIQTLVLVERQLKNFPVQSNFVGLHISTTLQEQIIVEQEQGRLTNAYLI